MRKPWRIAAISLFTAALAFGGLVGDHLLALNDETRDALRVYTDLITVAHERYGAEIRFEDLVFASIQGMLRSLDPHTSFLTPRAYDGMRERQQSSFYGLGILVGMRNGQLTVITPIEGTPASRMGLRAGDIIHTIEGDPTDSMSLDEAVSRLKGPKDTQVTITIVRRGLDEPIELSITRAEIPQTTVRQAFMIDDEVGYLQVSEFSRSTGGEVAEALAKLETEGMKKLILDLRNNGGGLLDQAIEVSEQFVPDGTAIVETRGRLPDSYQSYRASNRHEELSIPLIVLVNGGTASAAEILSGAIQDHDVGIIIGTPTWGKGLVQTVYSLSYGAGLALTTAKYYTPSGRLIQRDYTSFYDYYYDPMTGSQEGGETEGPAREPRRTAGEAFHTDLGREVYGGGGITPDVYIKADEVSAFELYLLSRNAFFEFGVDYTNLHPLASQDWNPDEEVMEEFRRWLLDEGIASPEQLDEGFGLPETVAFMRLQVQAEVFNSVFGQEASHKIRIQGDNQVQAALEEFAQAGELLERRAKLDREGANEEELLRRAELADKKEG